MSKLPHEYSNKELRSFLTRQQPSHFDYPGVKFEWDRRQEKKKAWRWVYTTILAVLTLLVLAASLVVQYRGSSVPASSAPSTSPAASQPPSPTTTQRPIAQPPASS